MSLNLCDFRLFIFTR